MKRFASSSLVAAALALAHLVPVGVLAQATTTPITSPLEVEYNGDSLNGEPKVFITAQQCESTTGKLKFSAKYTSPVPVLEAWIGKGTTKCDSKEARQKGSNASSQSQCRRVFLSQESTTQLSFEIRPRDLFWTNDTGDTTSDAGTSDDAGTDAGTDDAATADAATEDAGTGDVISTGGSCDLVTNQVYTVYILPLGQATDVSSNIAYDVIASSPSTLSAAFTLYTKRPKAPTDVKGGTGEKQLSVTFDIIAGAPQMTKYRAYFDWGTGGDGECGSGALAEGGSSPEKSATLTSVDTQSGKAELNNLDAKGIELNDTVAVAVVTVDPAGSESLLSETICVERQLTDNFLKVCERDAKCKNGFDSCSLHPGSQQGNMWLLGSVLAALGLAFVIRRRSV